MIEISNLPYDFFMEIENNEYLLGRVTLNKYKDSYTAEIDIVQKESKKIFRHVDSLYNQPNPREAVDQGVLKLTQFLRNLQTT